MSLGHLFKTAMQITNFGIGSLGVFCFQLILIMLVSFVSTVFLTFLLNRINHHIKFVPIIMLIVLIYALSKIYHLPGLIFILLFGLFLGNVQRFAHMSFIQRFKPEILHREVHRFHEIIAEGTFMIRVLFFVLFGFLIETNELLNLLPHLRRLSIGLMAITGHADSTLARNADLTLDVNVSREACPLNLAPPPAPRPCWCCVMPWRWSCWRRADFSRRTSPGCILAAPWAGCC